MKRISAALAMLALAGCAAAPVPPAGPPGGSAPVENAAADFIAVVQRLTPVAEAECRARSTRRRCDFLILVDDRPDQEPNAHQTVTRAGRPVIVFTLPLIAETRNRDELAFILGHEAAHHIAGHLQETIYNAEIGALVLGSVAQAYGYSDAEVESAAAFGAELGARRFSKEFELQADALGAVIAYRAGFDPVRGAAYFSRFPDPGDVFLGTHPPNAARQVLVREVAAGLS